MPKGVPMYGGSKGQSGMTPAGPETRKGAYGYSARSMADAKSPNVTGWNSYGDEPTRNAAIKKSMDNPGGGKTTY